jgi:hypothetical protein
VDTSLSGESGLNKKIVAVTLLVLMFLAVALTPIAMVLGQNTSMGVSIIRVVPASQANSGQASSGTYTGSVGAAFNLKGTIYTSYGAYNIIVGNTVVASGTADGFYVNSNFTVPQLPGGGYNLILEDVAQGNLNSTGTTPETFTITTAYSVTPVSTYIQEGSSVALGVAVTGGTTGTSYIANVSVVLPSPLNTTYSTIVTLGTPNQMGTANAQVTFPSSSFQPTGSTTNYAGSYTLYFNQSASLGQSQFSVGFLDSTTYHRDQTVTVKAIGYQPNQNATLTVTSSATGATLSPSLPQSLTASSDGIITATFTIPLKTAIGKYKATITTTSGTSKLIPDSEIFSVPGYPITITTVNLAGEVVPNISVQAQDLSANTSYNSTSSGYGVAYFNLETGPYSLTASWNGVNVGKTNITVTGAGNFNLVCELTDLVIVVQNENGTVLPFVNLDITYKYGSSQTGNISAETGSSGAYTLNSTLTGISYTIQASLYNQVFNSGNETVSSLPAQAVSQVVIICPTEQLTINVVGYTNAPISGASLELVELTNGLFYTATTDSSGSATAPVTFGMYKLQIYQNNILLNKTTVEAFSNSQYQIRCTLYGIQVTVSVVDYFGQPISNANVTVNGPSSERLSAITPGDGTTTFNNVVGGNLQIVAFARGAESNYQAVALTVDRPTFVQVKMDGYIVLGPFLIQTSALLTLIIVLVAVILLVTVEIYWRRRHRASGT